MALLLAAPAEAETDAARAARQLLDAYRDGAPEELRVEAIAAAKDASDPAVVAVLTRALRDPSLTVRRTAIDALGAIPHEEALQALHSLYRRNETLRKDEETFVRLLRAIGRKGDASSVAVLADDPFDQVTNRTAAARIQGLGRIRTDASLEALFGLTTKSGGTSRRRLQRGEESGTPQDRDIRLSIAVLTGSDLGVDRAEWARWWRDHRRSFRVQSERPRVSRAFVAQWEQYWGEQYDTGPGTPPPPRVGPAVAIVPDPTRAEVADAVAEIRAAFSVPGNATARMIAIAEFGGVVDGDVVAAVAKGLVDGDDGVRLAAIDALGWQPRLDALRQLHRLYRRDKKLRDDEVAFSRLLQAIGRHGSRTSLDVLKDHPFDRLTLASGRARILGIARVRDARSVGLLIQGMRLAGGDPRGSRSGNPRFMDEFRLGLAVLTGNDLGTTRDAWETWWRGHRDFVPGAARPPLAAPLRAEWEEYWDESY